MSTGRVSMSFTVLDNLTVGRLYSTIIIAVVGFDLHDVNVISKRDRSSLDGQACPTNNEILPSWHTKNMIPK